jgi:hypothetical protein
MLLAGIMKHRNVKHNPNCTEYNFLLGLRCSVMSLRQWANGSDIITHWCHAVRCNSAILSYAGVKTWKLATFHLFSCEFLISMCKQLTCSGSSARSFEMWYASRQYQLFMCSRVTTNFSRGTGNEDAKLLYLSICGDRKTYRKVGTAS